jgi:two-component system, OmpR family, phosphate regulon sensor histidine kinase PhoR
MRTILVAGVGLAALIGLVVLAAIARRFARQIRSVTVVVDRFGRGDLTAAAPEEGTQELVLLARSVNRMREDVAARLGAIERDRLARDAILSALEEGVVLFDPDGSVIYANESALRMVGGALEHARHLAPPTLRQVVEAAAAGSKGQVEEVTSGLTPRILVATAVPVPGDGNVLLVLRDVTEARTVDAVRRDFVANASHELKTPLASIQALAETIESAAADDPSSIPRFAEQLEREAIRLSRVVSDLLDLSRLEGEPGEWTTVRFDRLVRAETATYRERAGRAGLALAVTADAPAMVNGSPRDLGLLVRNLVENAVQYTRPGGSVAVSVATEDGQAVLQVRDTGLGIPLREQGRVFERFYRVDRARSRETGGTGLGLSIVKHVAENHGGRVSLRSELGRGSTFTVRLPLAG